MAVRGRSRYRGIAGMTKLRRTLGRLPPDVTEETRRLLADLAKDIERTAKSSARMGHMASRRYSESISHKIARSGLSARIGRLGKKAEKLAWFGHFIEFGTKAGTRVWKGKTRRGMRRRTGSFEHPGTPARPVLLPAFELHAPKFQPKIRDAINRALATASRGSGED